MWDNALKDVRVNVCQKGRLRRESKSRHIKEMIVTYGKCFEYITTYIIDEL